MTTQLYDPLTYENLMLGLTMRFEQQPAVALDSESAIADIKGPGIYSLHYCGDISFYGPIADGTNPIYVGKAVPPGARKGKTPDPGAPALRNRINEHLRSIQHVRNLDPRDFAVQALAVTPVWITLAERFLIDHYQPVWNLCLEGFGDHDPGKGRQQGEKSWWDTLHPGRPWADKLQAVKTRKETEEKVEAFFIEQAEHRRPV